MIWAVRIPDMLLAVLAVLIAAIWVAGALARADL